jgi:hypothetical protein
VTRSTAVARTRERATRPVLQRLAVTIVGVVVLGCSSSSTEVFSLQVGDCFQDPEAAAEEVHEVQTVPCDQPHDNEVYASLDLPDGDFPGADAIAEASLDGCLERFEEYVGTPYHASQLYATWLYPTESSWGEGDREVVCVLFAQDEQFEGSMQGWGR